MNWESARAENASGAFLLDSLSPCAEADGRGGMLNLCGGLRIVLWPWVASLIDGCEMKAPIPRAWEPYRKRRRRWFALLFRGPLFVLLPGLVLELLGFNKQVILAVVGIPYFTVLSVFGACWMWCPCPNCGQLYHHRIFFGFFSFGNAFARHCLHCGLPLWRDPEEYRRAGMGEPCQPADDSVPAS
jgi:hypothetical protein